MKGWKGIGLPPPPPPATPAGSGGGRGGRGGGEGSLCSQRKPHQALGLLLCMCVCECVATADRLGQGGKGALWSQASQGRA